MQDIDKTINRGWQRVEADGGGSYGDENDPNVR
jgi:hypothetical protein